MKDHVIPIVASIHAVIEAYEASNEDCDVNDVMSALALVLVQLCREFDVPRMSMIQNMAQTYEVFESEEKAPKH